MAKKLIILGTYPQRYVTQFLEKGNNAVLAMDTATFVTTMIATRLKTIFLSLQRHTEVDSSLPKNLLSQSGADGAALIETYTWAIFACMRGLPTTLERFAADANPLFVLASSGGGTGNGGYVQLLKILRRCHMVGRTIFIHQLDPTVNPEKQMSRIRDLTFYGTNSWRESHIIARNDKTVEDILLQESSTFDAIDEVLVNIRAAEGGMSI